MIFGKKGKLAIIYVVLTVLAILVALAPVYYDPLARFIFKPLWRTLGSIGDVSYRLGAAWHCFTEKEAASINSSSSMTYTATGAYTYGFITSVRWLGDIREFYVKLESVIPSGLDATVVDGKNMVMVGKVEMCDGRGCWVRSLWDKRFKIPVVLAPSGYIGWLSIKDGEHVFTSISAPLEPVPPYQRVYWLGNTDVYIGITTATLLNSAVDVKPAAKRLEYAPMFIYTEVGFGENR